MSTTSERTSKADKTLGWLMGMGMVVALALTVVMADRKTNHRHQERGAPGTPVVLGFDPPSFDFGTIPQAHRVEYTFRLVNRGTNDVSITLVKASCLCTVVATNFVGRDLRAGEELLVPVTFDSWQKEGRTDSSILFVLDYPGGRHHAEATLRGRVDPEFFVERPALDFGLLYPGRGATQTTVLRPGRMPGAPLVQTQMNFGPFQVLVTHQPDGPDNRTNATIAVVFSAPPLRQRELFTRTLRLETSSQRVPQVEITLKAAVVPEVEITPAMLVLGPNDGAGESRITVRSRQPSRIVRALTQPVHGPETVRLHWSEEEGSRWDLVHRFHVLNSALADATHLDVELEVRRGASETEARLASAQIKRLNESINNE